MIVEKALDLLFPPQCLLCETFVSRFGVLCAQCWPAIGFIAPPYCIRCGLPFAYTLGEGAVCAECIRDSPPYAQARAALRYDDASRKLVMALKYHDQQQLARTYARWMMQAGAELLARTDLIVPVPLHKRRFLSRRYNQSALLAQALARESSLPVCADALVRVRATMPQTGLSRTERQKNLKNAFGASPRHAEHLRGKNILLIDDVMTTGTTLLHCTKALHFVHAAEVNVLTLARRV